MQTDLFQAAQKRLKDNTVLANSIGEVEEIPQTRHRLKKAEANSSWLT